MKVLIVNTSECNGGAAIAANRLTQALIDNNVNAKMIVRNRQTNNKNVIGIKNSLWRKWQFVWERIVIWKANGFKKHNLFAVDIANTGTDITKYPEFKEADIIHLHWINQDMLSLDNLEKIIESKKPIVWTMHDMWTFTGICHHAYECDSYKTQCMNCPFLYYPKKNDLSYQTFQKKLNIYKNANMHIVAVSNWLANKAKESKLLSGKPISVIPNTISLSSFKIYDKEEALNELSLPDKKIILFGAAKIDDPIKGFPILVKAIDFLIESKKYKKEELHLVLFGKIKEPDNIIPQIKISYTDMGWVSNSDVLSKLYSAADVSVSASSYETFGQTLIEAQACGCIPVSFANSGQADIIEHKKNGYIAEYKSYKGLSQGIDWAFNSRKDISKEKIREEVIQKYSGDVVSKEYIKLYKSLTDKM